MSLLAVVKARAETIADSTGFSIDLDPRVTDVCVFIPEPKVHRAACADIDTASMAASIKHGDKTPIYGAIAHMGSWQLVIAATRDPAEPEVKPDQLEQFAATQRAGMAQGMDLVEPLLAPKMTRINGLQVVEVTTFAHGPEGTSVWLTTENIVTTSGVYTLWMTTEATHASEASDIVQASLRTLKGEAPLAAPVMSTEEKYARTGDFFGHIMEAVGGAIFLGFLVWLGLRSRRTPMPVSDAETKRRPKKKRKVVSWKRDGE